MDDPGQWPAGRRVTVKFSAWWTVIIQILIHIIIYANTIREKVYE